ncbi:MAG: RAMP superfamily CRISPR-associated protein [Bryobacteraceae bacterium]|nr:RAMP superfamily CRISPR-associated protein [Bryobacteraceae bacterium]
MSKSTRWKIEGVLETASPLHIGDGLDLKERMAKHKKGAKLAATTVAAAATDASGRAYLPASTLKGCLRSWLEERKTGAGVLESVFGSRNAGGEESVGGKGEFLDAFVVGDRAGEGRGGRYWDAARSTCVAAGVTIDRITRTATDEQLFHAEYVPSGIRFGAEVQLRDVADDEEIALALAALEALNRDDGARVGAGTNDGQGRMRWTLTRLSCALAVADWLDGKAATPWVPVDSQPYVRLALGMLGQSHSPRRYRFDVRLRFDANFLVNDPSVKERDAEAANHNPVVEDGAVVLPGSALRGAFRSQAERIVRTMTNGAVNPDRNPAKQDKAVSGMKEVRKLSLTGKVFGASGWAAPIHFGVFRPSTDSKVTNSSGVDMSQEFLAIDRFTGGGENGKKFRARSRWRPVLDGSVTVDCEALEQCGSGEAGYGLLALTLRDLMEGDICLGFGAAKGYGSVRAELLRVSGPGVDSAGVPESSAARRWVEALEKALDVKAGGKTDGNQVL